MYKSDKGLAVPIPKLPLFSIVVSKVPEALKVDSAAAVLSDVEPTMARALFTVVVPIPTLPAWVTRKKEAPEVEATSNKS